MLSLGITFLSLLTSISARDEEALCNYMFDANDGYTYPLERCSWSREGWSYGYFCKENWNNTGKLMVVEYQYDGPDCLNETSKIIYQTWDCEAETVDCNCVGNAAKCNLATRVKSDINDKGCNETTTRTSLLVHNLCIPRNDLGGMFVTCDEERGVINEWYEYTDCTGERIETPSPEEPYMGCTTFTCDSSGGGSGDGNNGGGAGGAIAAVVIILVLCCIGIVGFFCWKRKGSNREVYFDSNVDTM